MNNEWIKRPSAYNDTFMISFFSAFDYQLLGHLKRFDNQYPAKLLLTENETWLVAAKIAHNYIIIMSCYQEKRPYPLPIKSARICQNFSAKLA